jgi:hypothetical protein
VPEYCEHFRGKSLEELDELAKSFHYGKSPCFSGALAVYCDGANRRRQLCQAGEARGYARGICEAGKSLTWLVWGGVTHLAA